MKKCLKICSNVLLVIVLLITIINIIFLIKRIVSKEKCPTLLGYGYAIITSGSMSPTIETNDMIIIKKQNNYKVGDIVTFTLDNTVTTHRIVDIKNVNEKLMITTRGDYNNTNDDPFEAKAINGKVVLKIPKVGAVQKFLQSPYGIIVVGITLTIIFILPDFLQKKSKYDKQ